MRFCLVSLLFMASVLPMAGQEKQLRDCSTPKTVKLSPRAVKSLLVKTEPIQPFALGNQVRINSKVILELAIDSTGKVACLKVISGHPMLFNAVLESLKLWRFQPYILRGRSKDFSGRIALWIQATEHAVNYDVVETTPN